MTDLLYNAKTLSEIIRKPNIMITINNSLKRMADERCISAIITLADYSNSDIVSAKKVLEENNFKVVLMKDPNHSGLFHSMIIALPKN